MPERKYPVVDPSIPSCFGVFFNQGESRCQACLHAATCRVQSAPWRSQLSVAELVREYEEQLRAPLQRKTAPEEVFRSLFREFFGRPVRRISERNRTAIARAYALCLREQIDFSTYVAGNMWALRSFAEESRYGFQATMLSGDRALRRYHAYLGHRQRKYRAGSHDQSEGESEIGALRRDLYVSEYSVAEEYTTWLRVTGHLDWDRAVQAGGPGDTWLAVQREGTRTWDSLIRSFGVDRVRKERVYASLRVAAAILDSHAHALSSRVTIEDPEEPFWSSLAELIVRLFPCQEATQEPDLEGVSGFLWR